MTAKIWSYSGWINNANANSIRQGFKGVYEFIKETIISTVEAEIDGSNTLCWITERMNIIVTTFPTDGCAYINITTADDDRLYNLLSALPDYFDVLVNYSDGGILEKMT